MMGKEAIDLWLLLMSLEDNVLVKKRWEGLWRFVISKERDFLQKKKMEFEKLLVEIFYQPAQFPYQNLNLLREWDFIFLFFDEKVERRITDVRMCRFIGMMWHTSLCHPFLMSCWISIGWEYKVSKLTL